MKRTMADRSPQPCDVYLLKIVNGTNSTSLFIPGHDKPDLQGKSRRSNNGTTSSSSTTRSQPRRHRILSNAEEDGHITPPPIFSATASLSLDFLRSLELSPTSGRTSPLTLDNVNNNHVAPKESDVIETNDEHVDEEIDHGGGDSTGVPALEINSIAASTATTTHDNDDRQQLHATTTTRPAADHDNNSNDNDSVDSWLRSGRPVDELANERAATTTEQIDREWYQLFENPISPPGQRSASFDASFDQAIMDYDIQHGPSPTRSHRRTRSVSPVIDVSSPSLNANHAHTPAPNDGNVTTMEIDEPIIPWRPTQQPREYMSITTLMHNRRSRRYLRVPLFNNKHARLCFEAAINELVERHIVVEGDDHTIVTQKNNDFHDALYPLIAEFTRPRPRVDNQGCIEWNGMQQTDDEAETTDRLNNSNNLSASERRRLFRRRTAIREGRDATTSLFNQY
ncbi:hypothetical protein O0I10_009986 [Lichtheimia ornata]|uniref:Uncharacterized protein n=1 Tax=Lichtheimia ornata TaxID=688661 RepID=A0AAD7XVG4_9FUNG|nr:uncharacterized protein O0I10_009986 [Lichtheimia ornata]KAJ8654291.1 hypothetical protein O0I10_009986 [Lichtheimia ornata]